MTYSTRKTILPGASAVLAASATIFAAAVAITTSGPASAADRDYRFEVVQIASAGPGSADVTVRLVRAADGMPVADADISANAVATSVGQPGYRRFHVATVPAGTQSLQVSAKVPGPTRIERTFNSSIKAMLERKVPGKATVVTGVVTFDAW